MNVHLDQVYWLGLLVSVVLPVLVGLVTTRVTHPGLKAVLLLALSTVTGFVTEYAGPHNAGYSVQTAAVLALVGFGVAVLSHFGFWKPVGVAGRAQDSFVKAA
jgi:hypothetical protein